AAFAVGALVDHKGRTGIAKIELIGAEQVQNLDIALAATIENASDIAPARTRQKAHVEPRHARGGAVQHIEAVPAVASQPEAFRETPRRAQHLRAVRPPEHARADNDHQLLAVELPGPAMIALSQPGKHIATLAEHLNRERRVERRPDRRDIEPAGEIALAQPSIDDRRFPARVA